MVSAIRASMMGRKKTITVSVPSGYWEHVVADPSDASVTMDFRTDGQVLMSAGASPSTASNWMSGLTATNYDISFDGGGSWLNMSTNRSIANSRASIGISETTYDVRLRPAGGGADLATGAITLHAEVT